MVSEAGRALHYSTRHKNFYRLIVVLLAFVKKNQKTPQKELEIARSRMKELKNESD